MELSEAVRSLEELGGHTAGLPSAVLSYTIIEASSGGFRKSAKDPHPALWVDADGAVDAFVDTVATYLGSKSAGGAPPIWWWHRGAVLEKHMMTETDARGTQRVSKDRWAVSCAVGVEGTSG